MLEDKPFNNLVAARLRDFFQPGPRWSRGLWEVGITLSLRELLEVAEAAAHGVLSDAAVGWLCADLRAATLHDVGVPAATREHFQKCLSERDPLRFQSAHWFSLKDLTDEVNETYLLLWANALESESSKPLLKPERTARAIAAHLLDAGFSPQFLAAWLQQELSASKMWTLQDLVLEFHRLVRLRPLSYRVLVPVSSGLSRNERAPDWLPAPEVKKLLSTMLSAAPNLRYAGGWFLEVEQRDAYAAAHAAFEEVDRRAARLLVGRGQRMSALAEAYVFGDAAMPVSVPRITMVQRVQVRSIALREKLFAEKPTGQVDAAFELLAQIDGSPALAAAAGWAAIEALLTRKDEDKVVAARRLATLVAASFPRAELTSLVYQQVRARTVLGLRLDAMATNREKTKELLAELGRDPGPEWEHWTDRAAVSRMRELEKVPQKKLLDIQDHAERSFRRYYRHRNLVLHWGRTNPVALRACTRTTAPLLAAGIDRIAHAWFVHELPPIELAMRAQSRLDLAGRSGRHLTDLLEDLATPA